MRAIACVLLLSLPTLAQGAVWRWVDAHGAERGRFAGQATAVQLQIEFERARGGGR